jgi:predicted lipoprotein
LDHIRREAEGLLEQLEEHYYASAHKGAQPRPAQADRSAATLAELCAQAQAMIDDMHVQ